MQYLIVFIIILLINVSGGATSHSLRRTQDLPLLTVVVGEVGSPSSLLAKCQGDCDGDNTCQSGLLCMQRDGNEAVPGCSGLSAIRFGIDFCYDPKDDPTYVAPAPTTTAPIPAPATAAPVAPPIQVSVPDNDGKKSKCEGNCEINNDCDQQLACRIRDSNEQVPGCGTVPDGQNICMDPADEPTTFGSDDDFALKLYWQMGYNWQEEFFERKWCMKCHGNTCADEDGLFLTECGDGESKFKFRNQQGKETQIQIANTDRCLEMRPGSRRVFVDGCDDGNDGQYFNSGWGSFTGKRFELQTPLEAGCLTQQHWPKYGEMIFRDTCDMARIDYTSFWTRY